MVPNTRRYIAGAVLLVAAISFAGVAVSAVMPERGLARAALQAQPVTKPEAASAVAETSFIDRVVDRMTVSRRLSVEDAARYAHIFAFQDIGNFSAADTEIEKLHDRRLMGHVYYQRYMHSDYKTGYAEMASWLKSYSDHPGAQAIYDLAQRRKSKTDTAPLTAPKSARGVSGQHDFDVGQAAPALMTKYTPRARDIIRLIDSRLADSPTAALKKLNTPEAKTIFKDVQYDSLRTDIASSYFFNGKPQEAFTLAAASADRSGSELPMAGWTAGLAAWKLGKFDDAAKYFKKAATAQRASPWMASAGAFWAARSYEKMDETGKADDWMEKAAEYPRTFYGIIAARATGEDMGNFNWDLPSLTERHIRVLSAIPAGRRAIALADAERPDLAEAELRQINPGDNHLLQEAVIALSGQKGMPALAMRVGSAFKRKNGDLYDAALYPNAPWKPEKGFEVDRALVYAFIRQESNFDPNARNRGSGAQGLMQLMPATARHVAKATGDEMDQDKLRDPTVNIDLGQKYLNELLQKEVVDGNLFKLAVAYNAGPGKLARWQKAVDAENDPLLFIESIPAAETRIFVERVVANYWIYRMKFRQSASSLDNVAEGEWPVYVAQDSRRSRSFAAAKTFFAQ